MMRPSRRAPERGAVMIMVVAFSVVASGLFFALYGLGIRIAERETIQTSADSAAFSGAVVMSKWMNQIAFLNVSMSVASGMVMLARILPWAAYQKAVDDYTATSDPNEPAIADYERIRDRTDEVALDGLAVANQILGAQASMMQGARQTALAVSEAVANQGVYGSPAALAIVDPPSFRRTNDGCNRARFTEGQTVNNRALRSYSGDRDISRDIHDYAGGYLWNPRSIPDPPAGLPFDPPPGPRPTSGLLCGEVAAFGPLEVDAPLTLSVRVFSGQTSTRPLARDVSIASRGQGTGVARPAGNLAFAQAGFSEASYDAYTMDWRARTERFQVRGPDLEAVLADPVIGPLWLNVTTWNHASLSTAITDRVNINNADILH